MKSSGVVGVLLVLASVLLGACGGSEPERGGGASTSSPGGDAEDLLGEFRLGEPFGYLERLSMGSEVLFDAVERATQECMADRGLRYEPMVMGDPGSPGIAQLVMTARQQDPGAVVGWGFSEWNAAQPAIADFGAGPSGSAGGEAVEGSPDPNDPNIWVYDLPDAERAAWRNALGGQSVPPDEMERVTLADGGSIGWAPDACRSEGQVAIYGPLADWYRAYHTVTEDMVYEAKERVLADPAVQSGTESWVACMAEAGFEVAADLTDPIRQLRLKYPAGTPAASSAGEEAAIAPVDVRCFQQAGLVEAIGSAQREIEADVLEANEGVVTAYVEIYDAALQRARDQG